MTRNYDKKALMASSVERIDLRQNLPLCCYVTLLLRTLSECDKQRVAGMSTPASIAMAPAFRASELKRGVFLLRALLLV